ncbi:hypothetical protein [Vibrio maritimus]|uniref:hypothetical protein n=1 Tax=Vibrio maritimus TaxID=990268 RepID=UPI001F2BB263|nr:hypothetical protein [Vibrio maritimus]
MYKTQVLIVVVLITITLLTYYKLKPNKITDGTYYSQMEYSDGTLYEIIASVKNDTAIINGLYRDPILGDIVYDNCETRLIKKPGVVMLAFYNGKCAKEKAILYDVQLEEDLIVMSVIEGDGGGLPIILLKLQESVQSLKLAAAKEN